MQEAIKEFVEAKQASGNGIVLIDMPTGTGKTYNALQLIKKYINGEVFSNIKKKVPICTRGNDKSALIVVFLV